MEVLLLLIGLLFSVAVALLVSLAPILAEMGPTKPGDNEDYIVTGSGNVVVNKRLLLQSPANQEIIRLSEEICKLQGKREASGVS